MYGLAGGSYRDVDTVASPLIIPPWIRRRYLDTASLSSRYRLAKPSRDFAKGSPISRRPRLDTISIREQIKSLSVSLPLSSSSNEPRALNSPIIIIELRANANVRISFTFLCSRRRGWCSQHRARNDVGPRVPFDVVNYVCRFATRDRRRRLRKI